jgi:hypothetical protein
MLTLIAGFNAKADGNTKSVNSPFKTIRYEEDYSYLKSQPLNKLAS